jgi:hypothetical protein
MPVARTLGDAVDKKLRTRSYSNIYLRGHSIYFFYGTIQWVIEIFARTVEELWCMIFVDYSHTGIPLDI